MYAEIFCCILKCASQEKNAVLNVFIIPIKQKPMNFLLKNVFFSRMPNSLNMHSPLFRKSHYIKKTEKRQAKFIKRKAFSPQGYGI